MNQLNYHALEYILDNCVSGKIDMHEPIEVTNKLKNQKTDVPLLKHLLLLCRSDKKSLIHILSVLRYRIKNHLLELIDDNAFIRHYVQNVIHEWNLDVTPVDLFKDGLDQFDIDEDEVINNYNTIRLELKKYGSNLLNKKEIVALSKIDKSNNFEKSKEEMQKHTKNKIFPISSNNNIGLKDLIAETKKRINKCEK